MAKRLIEIDALRGIAIVCMVFFHGAFDWMVLGQWSFEPYEWPLIVLVRAVQFLFLGLVGVSVALSRRSVREQVKRGAVIFACGLLVSLATWVAFPEEYVRFGVLHFIGMVVPLVALLKGKRVWALAVAILCFVAGQAMNGMSVETPWLLWLGFRPEHFSTLDYFPLMQWLAVPLVGLVIGETVYKKGEPTALEWLGSVLGLAALGRHSLAIYLLHQPVLYFTLWALSKTLL